MSITQQLIPIYNTINVHKNNSDITLNMDKHLLVAIITFSACSGKRIEKNNCKVNKPFVSSISVLIIN